MKKGQFKQILNVFCGLNRDDSMFTLRFLGIKKHMMIKKYTPLIIVLIFCINSAKATIPPTSTGGTGYDSIYCGELRANISDLEKELKGYLTELVNSITNFMNGNVSWEKYLGDQRDLNSKISRTNSRLKDLKAEYEEKCIGPIIPPATSSPVPTTEQTITPPTTTVPITAPPPTQAPPSVPMPSQ